MRLPLARLAIAATCLLAASVFVAAEAAAQAQTQTEKKSAPRRRGDRARLTVAEIAEGGTAIVTAHDAVRMLRPWWLNPPPGRMSSSNLASTTSAATMVVVYIDGLRQPDVESSLVTIKREKLVEMRYYDQNRAVQHFGPGHEAGVIEVTTTDKRK